MFFKDIMLIFLQTFCFLVALLKTVNATDEILFLDPIKEIYKMNDKITISCRTKTLDERNFLFKRKGIVMMHRCKSYSEDPLIVKCGYIGQWYYMNATIERATWNYHGKYECIEGKKSYQLYLNITVPPKVEMAVSIASYNVNPAMKNLNNESRKLRGNGLKTNPYDMRNLLIKSIEVTCSSKCSFPAPTYLWDLTPMNRVTLPLRSMNADNSLCNKNESEGMVTSSSRVRIDCLDLQFGGLQLVECKAASPHLDDYVTKSTYIRCPDSEFLLESNRSRLISKKIQMKVTTGEMINIVVGCSVGVILLISGIIMICKHRNKDDLVDQYTMRQNNMDNSGYRV